MSVPTFDWSKFQKAESVAPQSPATTIQQNIAPQSSQFNWNQFSKEEASAPTSLPPSLLQQGLGVAKDALRYSLRLPARAAESALAVPRELGDFAQNLVPEKALLAGAEKVGLREGAEQALDFTKKYAPHKLFPTTEQTKEFTKSLFGEYLEPKNQFERIQDEVVSDAAALAVPLGGPVKALRPVFTALGAQLAKQGVKWFGGSEDKQNLAKTGVVGLSAFIRPKESKQLSDALYASARRARNTNDTVSSVPLEAALNKLETHIRTGGVADSGKRALEKIADVRKEMQGAQIPINGLEQSKIKINEALAGVYKDLEGNKPGIKMARRNLESVAKTVDDALRLYGKQNPAWESFYRPANEIHGAIASSQKARRWMIKHYKSLSLPSAAALFGLKAALGPAGTAAAAAGGGTALMLGEGLTKVYKSPTLRKYFAGVVSAALAEDLSKFTAMNKKLNAALEKQSEN